MGAGRRSSHGRVYSERARCILSESVHFRRSIPRTKQRRDLLSALRHRIVYDIV